eukprot:TRINITY_DN8917_c0_g1_i1.p1 TRINITY_DN8917_c0_g1~~TRINITY_DN8917_c0_g1_i1.p1  ORF type:complete len:183 (+),score=34.74 TRINITY_DN8917_c0_g1_i1:81-629(+)
MAPTMAGCSTSSSSSGGVRQCRLGASCKSQKSSGVVQLWQCCACGREWVARGPMDDSECCAFAPKVMSFGSYSAWGPAKASKRWSDIEDSDESDDEDAVCSKASLPTTAGGSGSRTSTTTATGSNTRGSPLGRRSADIESFASAFAASQSPSSQSPGGQTQAMTESSLVREAAEKIANLELA